MSANPDQVGTQTAQPRRTAFEQRLGTKPKRPGLPHRIAAVWRDEYDTLVNWPRGLRHLLSRGAAYLLVNTVALLLVAWLLPGVEIAVGFPGNVLAALALTLLAGAITFLVRPVVFLALGLDNVILTAVLTIIFMGLTLLVASWFMASVQIDGLIAATTASLIIAAINTVLTAVIGLDEDESFYRHSLKRMARSSGDVDDRPGPGFVIIQVDGLAEPILRNALRTGYMPFISRLAGLRRVPPRQVGGPRAVDDLGRPGRHPPRCPRRHPGLPLVGEGARLPDGLEPSGRRLRDRASRLGRARWRAGPAPGRRGQHQQPRERRRQPVPSPRTASCRRTARASR